MSWLKQAQTSIPDWSQPGIKLDSDLLEILKIVMRYVDRAWDVKIDEASIEQPLQDIVDSIERLSSEIEDGELIMFEGTKEDYQDYQGD